MKNVMPKETEIEILYSELKDVIMEKYEKMKGFPIVPMREGDISEYLYNVFLHNIDNITNVKDVIAEDELDHLKNDNDIRQILNRIKQLS